jgi:hypothetical protein
VQDISEIPVRHRDQTCKRCKRCKKRYASHIRHVIYRSDKEHLGGMERAAEGSRATGSIGEGSGKFWGDLGKDEFWEVLRHTCMYGVCSGRKKE